MSRLYMMTTITGRSMLPKFLPFYQRSGLTVNLVMLGYGTAVDEMLDYFGLDTSEKAVMFSIVTDETWKNVKKGLEKTFKIDVPGTGIAFIVPLSSIGGKRELRFLTESQKYEKEEESTLKDTDHELVVIISDQGYSDIVMDAAKSAGASGGTVLHANGTGMEQAESVFGVTLASEKDMIFIVTGSSQRKGIMKAVMDKAGMGSKAKAMVFSLPVTDTAGLRLSEEEDLL